MIERITILFLSLVLALVGCSKPTEEEAPEIDGDLVVMVEAFTPREPLDQVIRDFEAKYQGVRVQVREVTHRDVGEVDDPATYDGVDLVIGSWLRYQMQRLELLGDLSAVDLPLVDPYLAEWYAAAWSSGQRLYIPLEVSPWMIGINKGVFEEVGVPIPSVDWTYAEFEDAMRAMKAAGKHQPLFADLIGYAVILSHGGGFYDEEAMRWTFNTPQNRQALSLMRRLVADGLLTMGNTMGPDPTINFGSQERAGAGYHLMPLPIGPSGRATVVVSGRDAMMVSTTSRPETAALFLQELFKSTAFAEAGVRPTVENPAAMEAWEAKVGEHMVRATEAAWESLRRFPQASGFNWREDLSRFYKGEVSLDELLPDLDARANP